MESIADAIRQADDDLSPATGADFAHAVDKLLRYARTFNISTDRDGLIDIIRDGCRGMPRRALAEGVDRALAKWTDTFRLPQPGVIWDMIRDDVGHWEAQLRALRQIYSRMLAPPQRQIQPHVEPPENAEYIRETEDIVAKTVARLAAETKRQGRIG